MDFEKSLNIFLEKNDFSFLENIISSEGFNFEDLFKLDQNILDKVLEKLDLQIYHGEEFEYHELISYDLALKLKTFIFQIDLKNKFISFISLEPYKYISFLKELIAQKYPNYEIKFILIYPKDFYKILYKFQIQDQISKIINELRSNHKNNIDITKLYDFILKFSIEQKASDIHLQSYSKYSSLKIRIDGKIKEIGKIPNDIFELLINKIKLNSQLDISEKRLPQDGRIQFIFQNIEYDLRISCVPIAYGESIVIRILYKQNQTLNLNHLNISEPNLKLIEKNIHSPYGIILVAGPTGSGKSTSLYAMLESIKSIEKKLITIEDPIEYEINLATQVQINPEYGFDFPDALKAILRQDPDIIMIGEIRDNKTLELALQASLTGHLVFATIHTNNSASSIERLLNMGAEPYLIASSVICVISQRLIRKLCPHCKAPCVVPKYLKNSINSSTLYEPKGCEKCHMEGFLGREVVTEVLQITPEIQSLILNSKNIKEYLVKNHFKTLFDDAIIKIQEGISSYEEVIGTIKNEI